MQYISNYKSPLGNILISCDEIGLIGIWFENQKYYAVNLKKNPQNMKTDVIKDTKKWLDMYFKGENPNIKIPIHFIGTEFQKEVWNILLTIPYGNIMTYNDIAKIIAKKRKINKMSAQAVGGAVSRNPISIIVPCHRVVGSDDNLTGYAGGIDKKMELLKLEKSYKDKFYIPKKGKQK